MDPSEAAPANRPQFRETLAARLRRWILGSAYALQPKRIALMPRLTLMTLAHVCGLAEAESRIAEHPVHYSKHGLIGISQNLGVDQLVTAYRRGIFPVCHIGPMKWWSPAERAVLFLENTHIESNLRRLLRQGKYSVTFDRDFAGVMRGCAEPRPGKTPLTWITPRIMDAFWAVHEAGYAHSVEVWDSENRLVGGSYGLAVGDIFFGESQFSRVRDTSKIATAVLNCHLAHWGFVLRDAKWLTGYLASSGYTLIGRTSFEDILRRHAQGPDRVGRWQVDETLDVAGWNPRAKFGRAGPTAKPVADRV
jgi:leucyl/phenylalanyl-tRNA---protein transferase